MRAAGDVLQEAGELAGPVGVVVHAADARVLEGDPASLAGGVIARGVDHLAERIAAVQRDELVAQFVVGRVHRHRERHRKGLLGQRTDAGNHADGGDRDVPRREAGVAVQAFDRVLHGIEVCEWLAHTHEHHVRGAPAAGVRGAHHLLDDLTGAQVAFEAGLASGAEGAAHRAAGLRRHAHRRAVAVLHEHGLDLRAIRGSPQPLRGVAAVAALHRDFTQREWQGGLESRTERQRDVGDVVERAPLRVEAFPELAGPEGGLVGEVGEACERVEVDGVTSGRRHRVFRHVAHRAAATVATSATSVRWVVNPRLR